MNIRRVMTFLKNFRNEKEFYRAGRRLLEDKAFRAGQEKTSLEKLKEPKRTEVINYLLSKFGEKTRYLEIGVKDPRVNFDLIVASEKYSVDPGIEYKENPVDYKMTSDIFFDLLSSGKVLYPDIQFDVIFIDGLHLAEQVNRDIENALRFIRDDGFVVLHDCNPPTIWHARETYDYHHTPAQRHWNGTTWKAFLKWRYNSAVSSCCIDSDWGVGILSKDRHLGQSISECNAFFEFDDLAKNRERYLNLISFDVLRERLSS